MKKLQLIALLAFLTFSNLLIAQPIITSFAPSSGPIGTTVTITGSSFNTTPTNNIVFFGATQAVVTAASTTSLSVTVPSGATYHYISVTDSVSGLTVYSLFPFDVTFPKCSSLDATAFAPKVDIVAGNGPCYLTTCDLDGDGKPDFASLNSTAHTISIYLNTSNNGTISFAPKMDIVVGSSSNRMAIGDLNGDGKPDLVVTNYSSNTISVFKNVSTLGTILFAPIIDYSTLSNPTNVTIGDIDGDGKPELAVACNNVSSGGLSVYRNTSTIGTMSFAPKVDIVSTSSSSVAIGDINGDGKPDLVVSATSSSSIMIYQNNSTIGVFSFNTNGPYSTGTSPITLVLADMDGDGMLDIATSNTNGNSISVLKNTSSIVSISLASKVDYASGNFTINISVSDVDGDGKPDLAAVNFYSNTVSVFGNISTPGTIAFAAKVDFTTGIEPRSLVFADFDGGGKPSLIVANYFSSTVSILKNIIIGNPSMLSTSSVSIPNGGTVNIPFSSNSAATYTWVAADNPNTTGESTTTQSTSTLNNTLLNSSAVTQSVFYDVIPTSTSGCGVGPTQTVTVNVNSDYVPSIISFTPAFGPIGTTVTINGTNFNSIPTNNVVFFGAKKAIVSSSTPTSIVVDVPFGATYENISITDITSGYTAYSIIPFNVTFSSCGGINANSFAPKIDSIAGSAPNSIAVGDIDGDGKDDIVVSNYSANTISVFLNTSTIGNVSFAPKIDFAVGINPTSVAIGDLDGDGKPDLAVTNWNSYNVTLMNNTSTIGAISFAPNISFNTVYYPSCVAIGDIDNDGKPDLAVSSSNTSIGGICILKNNSSVGAISFAPKVDISTFPHSCIKIGEINGDGKLDIVASNSYSNNLVIFKNNTTFGSIIFNLAFTLTPVNYSLAFC